MQPSPNYFGYLLLTLYNAFSFVLNISLTRARIYANEQVGVAIDDGTRVNCKHRTCRRIGYMYSHYVYAAVLTYCQVRYHVDWKRCDVSGQFEVDTVSGVVTTTRPLDYEVTQQYELIVVAADQGPQSMKTSAVVSIQVLSATFKNIFHFTTTYFRLHRPSVSLSVCHAA